MAIGPLRGDVRALFASRILRLFAYGFLSVVLVLYLAASGLTEHQIGLLLTLTLVGDAAVSLYITTSADRVGRRRMLIVGAALMVFAGVLFAATRSFLPLLVAATFGVISPSGNEVGPFLAIEQAALADSVPAGRRPGVFAWYNLVGSFATAIGALAGGGLAQALQAGGSAPLASYRAVVLGYALIGAVLVPVFLRLSPADRATAADSREGAPGVPPRRSRPRDRPAESSSGSPASSPSTRSPEASSSRPSSRTGSTPASASRRPRSGPSSSARTSSPASRL